MDWLLIVALVAAGLLMLALEVYLPGFVVGALGIIFLGVALYLCYPRLGLGGTLAVFMLLVVLGLVVVFVSLKFVPRTPLGRKLLLNDTLQESRAHHGPTGTMAGQHGVAHTTLRPSGVAIFGGKRLDVVAESGMIEAGSAIKVVEVDGNRVVVRKL
jgi:membrane-bound serine protease (ClpP class)